MSRHSLRVAWTSVFLTLVVAPLVAVPYMGDDVANRAWANSSWGESIRSAWDLQLSWMSTQGRFFPGSSLYALPLWHTFHWRSAYTMWVLILNLAVIALVGFTIHRLSRSSLVTGAAVLFFGGCLQARWALDGLPAFAGMVQYTIILSFIAAVAALLVIKGAASGGAPRSPSHGLWPSPPTKSRC